MTAVTQSPATVLTIKRATFIDIRLAVVGGWEDFRRAPLFGLFFGGIYALGGVFLVWIAFVSAAGWMIYPLVIGFALIGPFVATGLYEVSRRLEGSEPLLWKPVLLVVFAQQKRELGWMAFVMLFVFWVWIYQARTLVAVFFGLKGFATFDAFVGAVFTTETGWWFLLVGHCVGAIISLVLYTLTVISCPLLLDKEIDFVTAMLTSIRTVLASPFVMLAWGIFVVIAIVLSAAAAFGGLLIVLPVLGHATWRLYCRLIRFEQMSP